MDTWTVFVVAVLLSVVFSLLLRARLYQPQQGSNPDQSPIERSSFYRGRGGALGIYVFLVVVFLVVLAAALIYFDVPPLLTQGDAQMATVR
jgi:hypothetical protein